VCNGTAELHILPVSLRKVIQGEIKATFASKLDAEEWVRIQKMKNLLEDFDNSKRVLDLLGENVWGWSELPNGRSVEVKWSSISGPFVRRSFSNKIWFTSDLITELERAKMPKQINA